MLLFLLLCVLVKSQVTTIVLQTQIAKQVISSNYGSVSLWEDHIIIGMPGDIMSSGYAQILHLNRAKFIWANEQKLTYDKDPFFGRCVAISGNTAMVGSNNWVYIFILSQEDHEWSLKQQLNVTDSYEFSGCTIKIYGKYALFFKNNTSTIRSYVRMGSKWSPLQDISTNISTTSNSIAMYDNTVVVGAPEENGKGAAYIFILDNSKWTPLMVLSPNDLSNNSQYGYAVDIFENTIVVSAPNNGLGAIYVYKNEEMLWNLWTKLDQGNSKDSRFGDTIALYSTTIVVGCTSSPGVVYIFNRMGMSNFKLYQKWIAADNMSSPSFGSWITMNEDTVLIGDKSGNKYGSTFVGYIDCPRGRTGVNCVDVDECNDTNPVCKEICVNIDGGYNCLCYDGTNNCLQVGNFPTSGQLSLLTNGLIWGSIFGIFLLGLLIFLCFVKKNNRGKFTVLPESDDEETAEDDKIETLENSKEDDSDL